MQAPRCATCQFIAHVHMAFHTGVMRFLQTEWHRHERDRNAWEIERAEMKSRIGRLEGDARTSKHLHESLGKHVKILEIALKKEREKVKSLSNGEKVDMPREPKETAKENINLIPKRMSNLSSRALTATEFIQGNKRKPRIPTSISKVMLLAMTRPSPIADKTMNETNPEST